MIHRHHPQVDPEYISSFAHNQKELLDGDVHIWIANLDQHTSLMSDLLHYIDEDEIAQAKKYKFDQLSSRYILSHGILRILISHYLGIAPESICYRFNKHRKPELDTGTQTSYVYFNMAHSGSYAIYAFSKFIQTGVDIEKWRTNLEFDLLVTSNFSPDEIAAYYNFPTELRLKAFFNGWTRKEAYIKAVGSGLYLPLDQFSVSITLDNEVNLYLTGNSFTKNEDWFLSGIDLISSYSAAIAVLGEVRNLYTWNWYPV